MFFRRHRLGVAPTLLLSDRPHRESGHGRKRRSPPTRIPQVYRICDTLTEAILYFMVVFSPWAFGSTPDWAVWVMNVAAYCLGTLLLTKWWIRWRTGYAPVRWDFERSDDDDGSQQRRRSISIWLTRTLASLTVLILAYCLVSAVNKRAIYDHNQLRYDYFAFIKWLPHSYDANRTWLAFWTYLGIGWSFWAIRDWLLEKSRGRGERREPEAERVALHEYIPARLRRLLWVLCISGALLGLESILQRLDGTNKLLWIREPRWNKAAEAQFGPWAYRSNGAQYFNLLWPVCLGFWWQLRQSQKRGSPRVARVGSDPEVLLLPSAVLLASAPILAMSRGGAIVAMGSLLMVLMILTYAARRKNLAVRIATSFLFTALLATAGYMGWKTLQGRIVSNVYSEVTDYEIGSNDMSLRSRFLVPRTPPGNPEGVIGLTLSQSSLNIPPNSLNGFVSVDGNLHVRLYGDDPGQHIEKEVPGFIPRYGGRTIELAVVKESDLSIFIDGERMETTEILTSGSLSWRGIVASSLFWVGTRSVRNDILNPSIRSAAFFNYALSESDLKNPWQKESSPQDRKQTFLVEPVREEIEIVPAIPEQVIITSDTDAPNGTPGWFKIERTAGIGALELTVAPSGARPPQASDGYRISLDFYNPNSEMLYASAACGRAPGSPHRVPPFSESSFSVRAQRNRGCDDLRIALTDSEGQVRKDLQTGHSIYIKNLKLEPLGMIANLDLIRKPWLRLIRHGLSSRMEIYRNAERMARDFPIFGTGAGTFMSVYKLYRGVSFQQWQAYAHNDWLETRITFGFLGSGVILLMLLIMLMLLFTAQGMPIGLPLKAMMVLAMLGCLVHARFDFPFQIYSIVFLFVIFCSILSGSKSKLLS